MKSVSIAEAKNRLPELVHASELAPIEIMRRGRPVAVLMSTEHFARTQSRTDGVTEAAARCRAGLAALSDDGGDNPFEGVRDRSPGRDVKFLK
jgi:prevent-host-death family protein